MSNKTHGKDPSGRENGGWDPNSEEPRQADAVCWHSSREDSYAADEEPCNNGEAPPSVPVTLGGEEDSEAPRAAASVIRKTGVRMAAHEELDNQSSGLARQQPGDPASLHRGYGVSFSAPIVGAVSLHLGVIAHWAIYFHFFRISTGCTEGFSSLFGLLAFGISWTRSSCLNFEAA